MPCRCKRGTPWTRFRLVSLRMARNVRSLPVRIGRLFYHCPVTMLAARRCRLPGRRGDPGRVRKVVAVPDEYECPRQPGITPRR